jgi:hypothetical protein
MSVKIIRETTTGRPPRGWSWTKLCALAQCVAVLLLYCCQQAGQPTAPQAQMAFRIMFVTEELIQLQLRLIQGNGVHLVPSCSMLLLQCCSKIAEAEAVLFQYLSALATRMGDADIWCLRVWCCWTKKEQQAASLCTQAPSAAAHRRCQCSERG